jgi:hypothetical protein
MRPEQRPTTSHWAVLHPGAANPAAVYRFFQLSSKTYCDRVARDKFFGLFALSGLLLSKRLHRAPVFIRPLPLWHQRISFFFDLQSDLVSSSCDHTMSDGMSAWWCLLGAVGTGIPLCLYLYAKAVAQVSQFLHVFHLFCKLYLTQTLIYLQQSFLMRLWAS